MAFQYMAFQCIVENVVYNLDLNVFGTKGISFMARASTKKGLWTPRLGTFGIGSGIISFVT